MKVKFLHSIITLILLGNILFAQVISNFFHTHTAQTCSEKHIDGEATLHQGEAKCILCSLDLSHDAFYLKETIFTFRPATYAFHYTAYNIQAAKSLILESTERGPPTELL